MAKYGLLKLWSGASIVVHNFTVDNPNFFWFLHCFNCLDHHKIVILGGLECMEPCIIQKFATLVILFHFFPSRSEPKRCFLSH